MNNTRYYAVFGDIHGRIALMYTLARLWMQHTHHTLEALLQVGDMGAFPDINKLDKATLKFAKKDADELGFAEFVRHSREGIRYFEGQTLPRTWFCRGNHEDFDYLSTFREPTPVDQWCNLWFLPDAKSVTLSGCDTDITLAALGGIEPYYPKRKHKQKVQDDPRYFSEQDINNAFFGLTLDVLMTHAGPCCDQLPTGSPMLSRLAQRVQPRVHLFGHHHMVVQPCEGPGGSLLVGLEHLAFQRNGSLKQGSWGILQQDQQGFSFTFADNFPWLSQVTKQQYRHLW